VGWELILDHASVDHDRFYPGSELAQLLILVGICVSTIAQLLAQPRAAVDRHLEEDADIASNSLVQGDKVLRAAADVADVSARVEGDHVDVIDDLLVVSCVA